MASARIEEMSGDRPLEQLERAVRLASNQDGWEEARFATHADEPGTWRARTEDDPLKELLARVELGKRAAHFAPPLTGIVSDLDVASELYGHPQEGDFFARGYDVLERLSKDGAEEVAPVSDSLSVSKASENVSGGPPMSSVVDAPRRAEEKAVGKTSGGVVADALLEALATRALAGEARAEAARLLAQGLVLHDEELMQEALAILLTGQM